MLVDDAVVATEECAGLYFTVTITSETLVIVIKDTFLRVNLKTEHCLAQTKEVTKMLDDEGPCAILTHCYGHALNLVVCNCVKQCHAMENTLECIVEVSKLSWKSPKQDAASEKLKAVFASEHEDLVSYAQYTGHASCISAKCC